MLAVHCRTRPLPRASGQAHLEGRWLWAETLVARWGEKQRNFCMVTDNAGGFECSGSRPWSR